MIDVDEVHGWKTLGFGRLTFDDGSVIVGGTVSIAPLTDPDHRCVCTVGRGCQQCATQEDLLCDGCRGGHE